MDTSDDRLLAGIAAFKQGNRKEASRLVTQAVRLNPKNEQAWLWLSGFVDTAEKRRQCFERVLALNPDNEVAKWGMAKLMAASTPKPVEAQSQPPPALVVPPRPEPKPPTPSNSEPIEAPVDPQLTTPEPLEETAEIWEAEEKSGYGRILILATILILLLALIAALYFFSTNSVAPPIFNLFSSQAEARNISPEEETAVINTIYDNIAAGNVENIDRYMASIHSQSSNYNKTRQLLEEQYRDYDLTAVIRGLQIISYSPEEARVSFVLETHKRSGPSFRDNQIWGIFILRPEDGQWKLYDQIVNKIEYLDP